MWLVVEYKNSHIPVLHLSYITLALLSHNAPTCIIKTCLCSILTTQTPYFCITFNSYQYNFTSHFHDTHTTLPLISHFVHLTPISTHNQYYSLLSKTHVRPAVFILLIYQSIIAHYSHFHCSILFFIWRHRFHIP